jgi:hypothetical protein
MERWRGKASSAFYLNQDLLFDAAESKYGFPVITPYTGPIPDKLVSFNDRKIIRAGGEGFVHFYIDDYYFERVWATPETLVKLGEKFDGFISPDFSVYGIYPKVMNLWNMYRNRYLTAYLQHNHINVIPDVAFADEDSFEWAFLGLPKNDVLAISTVGTKRSERREMFIKGFAEMNRVLRPRALIVYGEYLPVKFENFVEEVYYFPTEWAKKRSIINGNGPWDKGTNHHNGGTP